MKVIVFKQPDGSISVMTPCVCRDDPEGFTHDHAVQRALTKDVPSDATEVQVIEHTDLPNAPIAAWVMENKAISVSQEKLAAIPVPMSAEQRVVAALAKAAVITERQATEAIQALEAP